MIDSCGILFKHPQEGKKANQKSDGCHDKDLVGDSGVGQALEFPTKSLSPSSPQKTLVRSRQRRFFSISGGLLILMSLVGFLFTYGPLIRVELGYRITQQLHQTPTDQTGFVDLLKQSLLESSAASSGQTGVPDPDFSIIIPKIGARAKIISPVDPANEQEYMLALKQGVAHAAGTRFPGQKGNIYLFAHSTDSPFNAIRFNAVFYLLRELQPGDEIEVYFQGVKHRYAVVDKKIVMPTDVSYLTADNVEDKEQLILQTCYPPGTRQKRLLVFGEKVMTD